jgi:hypothetical protein
MKSRVIAPLVAGCLAIALAGGAAATPGDTFKIASDRVNLRAGPSDAATVRSQVLRGEEVVELRRDGNWLGVRVLRTGEEGWIFSELLTPSMISTLSGNGAAGLAPAGFAELSRDFDRLMGLVNQRAGYPLVQNVRQRDGNALDVSLTPAWLRDGSRDEHVLTALTIYQMWKNHQNSAPVRLSLLTPDGEPYIVIDDMATVGPAITIESGQG